MTKTKYLTTAWTVYGVKEVGGRWNSVSVSMVYVAEMASLTILEMLVHLHAAQIMDSFTLLSIKVPVEQIQSTNLDELPDNWADEDTPQELAVYGDAWSFTKSSVALYIPSALSPVEFNYLLNPEHPDFYASVRKAQQILLWFDSRLTSVPIKII
jgi:RES domain-containing protein